MVVETLSVRDFRNLCCLDLEPGSGLNAVYGANGQGKTSLLEAIHFASEGRSFRATPTAGLVRSGARQVVVEGRVRSALGPVDRLRVLFAEGKRLLTLNERTNVPIDEYLGHIRVVVHSPEDSQLILGPPELRRRFLNRVLVLTEPGFYRTLVRYVRALKNRNRCLQMRASRDELESWTEVLLRLGSEILSARIRLVRHLSAELMPAIARITHQQTPLTIRYHAGSDYDGEPLEPAAAEQLLRRHSERRCSREIRFERTLFGPHLDDVHIHVESGPARRNASQGERRSLLIGLRLAERAVIAARTGEEPIFLLDDLSSELDEQRAQRVIDAVADLPGQTFVTGTAPPRSTASLRLFRMSEGELTSIGAAAPLVPEPQSSHPTSGRSSL